MNLNKIDANLVKIEARVTPPPDVPKRGSAFGRFLRGFGALAAPVGYATSFFFPPAALVGAAAYGLGQFGAYKDSSRSRDIDSSQIPTVLFPAVNTGGGAPGPSAASFGVGDPMEIIANRQDATNEMIGQVR